MSVEFLICHRQSNSANAIIMAMRADCPMPSKITHRYEGLSDILMVWGYGADDNNRAIVRQLQRNKRVISWDFGYFSRAKTGGYMRVSLDDWHPQRWIEKTPGFTHRWDAHGIALREDCDPAGHIVLVGMGPKSHQYLHSTGWEARKLRELRQRFPGRRIVYRPKPKRDAARLDCDVVAEGPIAAVLQGASLVVCRHSNVAVDATIAGVPFECEDGAAKWLQQRAFTPDNRLDFLHRLAHWQYKPDEAKQAWQFLRGFL
jgi:hypothetical protein